MSGCQIASRTLVRGDQWPGGHAKLRLTTRALVIPPC